MRTTIRTRILSIFVAVALIQALLIGAFFLSQSHQARNTHVHQQLNTTVKNLNNQITLFLQTTLHDLETASQQVERMAQKDYQRYNLLNILKNNNSSFSSIVFYDINGVVRSSISSDKNTPIDSCFTQDPLLFDVPYYTGTPYVTQFRTEENVPYLVIAQPVKFLEDSYVIGVISAIIPFDSFQKIIAETVFPPDITALITNDEGMILAHNSTTVPELLTSTYPVKQQWNGNIHLNHQHVISISSDILFYGQTFTVAAYIPADKSWVPNGNTFILLVLLILLLLLLSALIGWTTNKKIIEPLQLLANDSTTMLQGKNFKISPSTDVEFHDVSNAMQTINLQLQQTNIALEKEVEKRREGEKLAIDAKIEAEKTTQAKSIFLANMSHEIRTPLNGMLGLLEMIAKDPLNTEQKQLLSLTSLSGQRLHTVVNSILDLSQLESGKIQLHHSPFSLSNLISEVILMMQVQIEERNIQIKSTLAADIPDDLIGDSGRIRQILINLINNSIKFSDKGLVELRIDRQSQPSESEIELLFSIKDRGCGISESAGLTIFNAFDRGDVEKDNVIEGTGLGLTISAEFVQHMKGTLWLGASDKNGSTFCFTIFCSVDVHKRTEIQRHSKKETRVKKLSGTRVFLAEDEFINQRIISAYLEEHGCIVTVCANGQELLDSMEMEVADIILMDIRMPVMNGIEATKCIRKKEKDTEQDQIPIVALTAQATTDFEKKCKEAGMNDYLTKPIPFKKLLSIIERLAKRRE